MNQQPLSPAVSHDVALHCDDELGRPMAFIATFSYHRDDPYAVWLTFHVPAGDLPWVVDRALLHRGLSGPVGEGDIRLWPGADDEGRAVVHMDFHSPEGRLAVAARTGQLLAFLAETWDAVPAGTESSLVDIDRLVAALLT